VTARCLLLLGTNRARLVFALLSLLCPAVCNADVTDPTGTQINELQRITEDMQGMFVPLAIN